MSLVPDATSATPATGAAGQSQPKSQIEAAEERFLTLLVTQMRNQDPLNPLDNAQVTTQLAQLNTVAGISKLNQTLEGLAASFAASQTLQAAALIGRGVMVAGSALTLANGQALFGAELSQAVDRLDVTILDAAGNAIHRASAGAQQAGIVGLHWDGATDAGGTAAAGRYRFVFSASSGGKVLEVKPLAVDSVESVTPSAAGARLHLKSGAGASLADVKQII